MNDRVEEMVRNGALYVGVCVLLAPHLPWYVATALAFFAAYKIQKG